ncbi:hypothetical protein SAMN05444583_102236 [Rhodococcus maanshanensis]|uniref:Uncharacterized protein n=1 Tax=Rhodococcus maanshanensis TaxID=183556 RepID=A0A1H7HUU3_9NOCA|nr:hypothetical protein SAMN05444583_102236 [Rhodococcus maanshanensis]
MSNDHNRQETAVKTVAIISLVAITLTAAPILVALIF